MEKNAYRSKDNLVIAKHSKVSYVKVFTTNKFDRVLLVCVCFFFIYFFLLCSCYLFFVVVHKTFEFKVLLKCFRIDIK